MSNIEIIFFDVYGTIAGFDPPRDVIQRQAAAEFGFTLTKEGVDRGYKDADELMARQNAKSPVSYMNQDEKLRFFAEFECLVLRGDGVEVSTEVAGKIWEKMSKMRYGLALFPDVIPMLRNLKEKKYRAAVISNMPDKGADVQNHLGLDGYVDFTVTSGEVGVVKPAPGIFRRALEIAGVEAVNAVHIGDQIESDIVGAFEVGIYPMLMDRYGWYPHYTKCPRLTGMADIPNALRNLNKS